MYASLSLLQTFSLWEHLASHADQTFIRLHFNHLWLLLRSYTQISVKSFQDQRSETWTLKKRDRKQLSVFEMKVYRRILGPVYDNEKENWRILTNKEIYESVKKPTIIETIRLNRLRWFGHVQRMEENRIPKRVLYMNLGTTRLRGRPRNRWPDEVREDGRLVCGKSI